MDEIQIDLTRFFELSIDMMCVAGVDGYFKHVNPAFEKTLGYSQAELLSKPFIDFVHSDDVAATLAELENLTAGISTNYFENRYRCRDGSYKWLEWTAYPVDDVFYAVARDITQQQQFQIALEESGKLFRTLLDTASVGIFIVDERGLISLFNVKAREMFGYDRLELIKASIEILLPDRSRHMHSKHRADYFANPSTRPMGQGFELYGRHKNGHEFPVEIGLSSVETSSGTFGIAFVIDISARKQFELEREKLIEDLEAFAHTVAHDLKSPLAVTVGLVDLLNSGYFDLSPDEQSENLVALDITARKMISIVDALLLLARVQTIDDIEREPLDMHLIMHEVLARLDQMIQEYEVEITLPVNWPTCVGYALWVEEVWINLLSNAIKYGGRPPIIQINAAMQDDGMIRYWVDDNGQGLTLKEQKRLFTPFTRLNQSQERGHGLGLSIVKRIVTKLGGQVGVKSKPNSGSLFYFTLPSENVD
ncbi:MAG: PAS domain-containing sensor histidine kinase [Chloroflexi bacterium]|nr:MAG: PAS domain-containing sensor histidine kinase [Chloroflexota bacterium]